MKLLHKFINVVEIKTIYSVLFLTVVLSCLIESVVFSEELRNDKIRAELGPDGLMSVYDILLEKAVRFKSDYWSITLDGQTIRSQDLRSVAIQSYKNGLCYVYNAEPFAIEVRYQLKPEWRFISKQIVVRHLNSGDFHIDHVEVFHGNLKRAAEKTHIIQTAREVFRKHHDLGDYGFFQRYGSEWGAFFLVQNPFLESQVKGTSYAIGYTPNMPWKSENGPYHSDRGCIGTYKLTGRYSPSYMNSHPEWKLDPGREYRTGIDLGEINAYIDCVRAFLLYNPEKSVRVHVPWCENDYQINVATEEGRTQWKRIVDMAADLNIEHMLYTCRNDVIATIEEAADAWRWEHLLWLNMGVDIRRNEWDPRQDVLPRRTRELMSYAEDQDVRMMAYVYPSLPFEQRKDWLTQRFSFDPERMAANMGFRSFQDWLIENLLSFKRRTGISGYAFDYWFLTLPGPSKYSQWYGCRRVLEALRKQEPDIVIDGRQSYHVYGPWTWLAGSYPHPTAGDEQPESFNSFPDLHFDRCSATHQRYTAYWFRNTQFCPVEIMPGFIGHQVPRHNDDIQFPRLDDFNLRNWDYLGWKFSLFSSIATAPLSHCVDMIPARDVHEFIRFPEEDKAFFRSWLDWTDEHAKVLKKMKTITGPPAIGYVDGTAAIDGDRGFIFLFNPNHRKLTGEFILDETIGVMEKKRFMLKELFPEEGRLIGKPRAGVYQYGDTVSLKMDGTTALVLELIPLSKNNAKPVLFNVRGEAAIKGGRLILSDVVGEIGTDVTLQVLLPTSLPVTEVLVNDRSKSFWRHDDLIEVKVWFAGKYFGCAQQIDRYDPGFAGNKVKASFVIPQRIFDQLAARKEHWLIPWEENDYQCTWLVPERLLLYIQIAEPDWRMNVNLTIDGIPVEVKKAYSSITPDKLKEGKGNNTFTGFYVDVSDLKADQEYNVELTVPSLKPGQYQGMFFENVETDYTNDIAGG